MSKAIPESVADILLDCGFVRHSGKPALFLFEEPGAVTPAFYCDLLRKQGKVQLSGGIGLFFTKFEETWNEHISGEEKRIDGTLPIIMLISNYLELIDSGALRYYDLIDLRYSAQHIYNLARKLPASPIALDKALSKGILLDKPVSDYLHIFDYNDDENLYFRKSAHFVHWFIEQYPNFAHHMCQCLTQRQAQRLGLQ